MRLRGARQAGLLAAVMLFAGLGQARADEFAWLGVHGAYYGEYEKWGVGMNARQDLGNHFSAGMLVDYVIRSNHSTWAGNVDLQYERRVWRRALGWVGVGGGVIRDDLQGDESTPDWDPTAVGYVGLGLDGKPFMPYVEMRILSHGNFHGVFYAGFRF
jgi:hypothetical protein